MGKNMRKIRNHCHTCKYIDVAEGCAHCINPDSEFYDGKRIRSWGAFACAEQCKLWEKI